MRYRTCECCGHRKDCEVLGDMKAKLKGLKLTSVAFRCDLRTRGMWPGRRVKATVHDVEPGEYGLEIHWFSAKGTIISVPNSTKYKALVLFDLETELECSHLQSVKLADIQLLHSTVNVCPGCHWPLQYGQQRQPNERGEYYGCLVCGCDWCGMSWHLGCTEYQCNEYGWKTYKR